MDIISILVEEFKVEARQIEAMIELLDAGNTIPFIARYRKEMTGGLNDVQLREMSTRLEYLRGLEARRAELEEMMRALGVLNEAIIEQLSRAKTMTELEDVYRPYRPKRRTRASIAAEKGLTPLADWLMAQYPSGDAMSRASRYIDADKGVVSAEEALAGARDILAERISDDARARTRMRGIMERRSVLKVRAAKEEDSVYSMYYEFGEQASRVAAHRILAINRGEREGYLKVSADVDGDICENELKRIYVRGTGEGSAQVEEACGDAWKRLMKPSLERELRNELTDAANARSIKVFAENLQQLLMQPPIRGKVTLGVDPGFRTGCKLAVVDANGRVLETGVGYFTLPGAEEKKKRAEELIRGMIRRHGITAIAIGNGTASRESEAFIAELIKDMPNVAYCIVSEAGASVYSAGETAQREFPDMDVTQRSAISIARRMQDPLAELVKIDPKSIGVGQYQHDLKQNELTDALDGVVERCVTSVGVEVSTASAELLSHVAGVNRTLAENIAKYRDENGIASRAELKKVPRMGPKAFEQCAGFLRVRDSAEPLDAGAVHPESYSAARAILKKLGCSAADLKAGGIRDIREKAEAYGLKALEEELKIGAETLKDILSELQKPGRDPRDELQPTQLRKDVLDINDLKPGMELTGTVRNVTDFGAFVDIGVHHDGLVHISRMSDRFIRHPSEIVKVGDRVKVWVIEADVKKARIALTMVEGKL